MSSPLAFDKQGNPFSFHKRTRQLRVRLFRNPSARGTCSHVLDTDGSPLYVDSETEYPLFRQLVGNVPGLYRLDQCDDDGAEIDDAPAAYVTVDPPRNAQPLDATDGVSALAVIREMAAVQREMAAIQGQALKALADNHSLILASAAEVMRAPRPAPIAAELRNASDETDAGDEDDDEDEDFDDDDANDAPSSGAGGLLEYLTKMIDPKDAQKFGMWVMKQFMQFRRETATDAPPAAPASTTVTAAHVVAAPVATPASPAAPSVVVQVVPVPVAASPEAAVPSTIVVPEMDASTVGVAVADADMTVIEAREVDPAEATDAETVGQFPPLTQEQLVHLAMINAQLSSEERTIAENVMRRMGTATMQRWIAKLSDLPIADATATVREAIAEWKQQRNKKR